MKPLEMHGVSLAIGDVEVLSHIDFTVEAGDFVGLIGPNGGGKTVLLKIILGLLKPDAGSVRVFGREPEHTRAEAAVGYVPQYPRFEPDFPIRVFEVALMGRLHRYRPFVGYADEDRDITRDALDRVGMLSVADREIGVLSGGQRQRVLIARALAMRPKLLLLDEPTASLDTPMGQELYELLADLSPDTSIVLVTHDLGILSRYVKTVGCLNCTLHYHHAREISQEVIEEMYGCPVDLVVHEHQHRVLKEHDHD